MSSTSTFKLQLYLLFDKRKIQNGRFPQIALASRGGKRNSPKHRLDESPNVLNIWWGTPVHLFLNEQIKCVFLTGQWPPGHYCILASGACPAGFTRSQGHMRALKIYGPSATYITQATFGDSKIQCHGPCGRYGQWIGELYIAACCKWWSTQKTFVTRHK